MSIPKQLAKLAVSVGEPAGIGPDALIMLMQEAQRDIIIAFCDPELIKQRALNLALKLNLIIITETEIPSLCLLPAGSMYVLDAATFSKPSKYLPGILQSTAEITLEYLDQAARLCLEGYCDALVTCPIQKSNICVNFPNFMGHTEYLAELCDSYESSENGQKKSHDSVMLLMNTELKVALVTTHIPLSKVSTSITSEKIIKIAKIIHHDLKEKFHITHPHILITGLNPHAGEDGVLGMEEQEFITPAIQKLINSDINASGPYAADSLFSKQFSDNDVVLAMYHDQGLTGFKARSFNTAANVTLGLPLIRTSVDHGTALDKAGTGNINIGSLKFAIKTASQLAHNRNRSHKYG